MGLEFLEKHRGLLSYTADVPHTILEEDSDVYDESPGNPHHPRPSISVSEPSSVVPSENSLGLAGDDLSVPVGPRSAGHDGKAGLDAATEAGGGAESHHPLSGSTLARSLTNPELVVKHGKMQHDGSRLTPIPGNIASGNRSSSSVCTRRDSEPQLLEAMQPGQDSTRPRSRSAGGGVGEGNLTAGGRGVAVVTACSDLESDDNDDRGGEREVGSEVHRAFVSADLEHEETISSGVGDGNACGDPVDPALNYSSLAVPSTRVPTAYSESSSSFGVGAISPSTGSIASGHESTTAAAAVFLPVPGREEQEGEEKEAPPAEAKPDELSSAVPVVVHR